MIFAVGVTWYSRTRDMDFFPEAPLSSDSQLTDALKPKKPKEKAGPPAPKKLANEVLEKILIAPGLDAYIELATDLETLTRLRAIKHAEGEHETVYFLTERLLETGLISEDKRALVERTTAYLPTLKPWVYDENEVYPATLTISSPPLTSEKEAQLRKILTFAFSRSSGGMIKLQTTFITGAPTITLTINNTLKLQNKISAPTNHENIVASLYSLLSSVINEKFSPQVTLATWNDASINELEIAITRYAWKLLLQDSERP